ncbi:uncharacterized protein LOC109714635 [Ananas comosus]|uniref:Uncharacterized protein LOC109714635 n=1 Tax=Ananas comosus TaxID=4615 RepID=A0A6P5FG49_ANACO|nr:uncharacterized protein LOC109714635 [Ananas comosus]
MGSVQRLIPQFADMMAAEVSFNSGHSVITIITSAAYFVVIWINGVIQFYSPRARARRRVIVGLHISRRSMHNGPIALLQLCVANQCLIYQLLHRSDAAPPVRLYEFLDDNRFRFTGFDVERSVNSLRMEFGLTVRVWADLGDAASRRLQQDDLRWAGLDQLVREVMGMEMIWPNEVRWTTLLERVLPLEYVPLACVDAVFSYELGRILLG